MADLPGPTGEFPDGKMNEFDEGQLTVFIQRNEDGQVVINFGKEIAWLAFPPKEAIEFAKLIIANAGEANQDN